eukprot:4970433-Pleurochrysis_carterae.AAC.1
MGSWGKSRGGRAVQGEGGVRRTTVLPPDGRRRAAGAERFARARTRPSFSSDARPARSGVCPARGVRRGDAWWSRIARAGVHPCVCARAQYTRICA